MSESQEERFLILVLLMAVSAGLSVFAEGVRTTE